MKVKKPKKERHSIFKQFELWQWVDEGLCVRRSADSTPAGVWVCVSFFQAAFFVVVVTAVARIVTKTNVFMEMGRSGSHCTLHLLRRRAWAEVKSGLFLKGIKQTRFIPKWLQISTEDTNKMQIKARWKGGKQFPREEMTSLRGGGAEGGHNKV